MQKKSTLGPVPQSPQQDGKSSPSPEPKTAGQPSCTPAGQVESGRLIFLYVLEASLKVILGLKPLQFPSPRAPAPIRVQCEGVSTLLPGESRTHSLNPLSTILSARMVPAALLRASLLGVPLLLILGASPGVHLDRACYHLTFLGKTFFFPLHAQCLSPANHLQHPAERTLAAEPAQLSLDTRSSVTKQLPKHDSHGGRLPREAVQLSPQRASEIPGER